MDREGQSCTAEQISLFNGGKVHQVESALSVDDAWSLRDGRSSSPSLMDSVERKSLNIARTGSVGARGDVHRIWLFLF